MHNHLRNLRARSTRNISIANRILGKNDIVAQSCGISGSGRDTDVSHVARQDDLLGARAFEVLVEGSVRE